MPLLLEPYRVQLARWPADGKHILAQYDADSIVVYQAYHEGIARWAVEHQRLGGPGFGLERMTWIKPNFLWMMYRSGWATKHSQEHILALRLARAGFDAILARAVPSTFGAGSDATRDDWQAAVAASDVRLQWDPDHDPAGQRCQRRAIQLGLRGPAVRQFIDEWIVAVEDITELVHAQDALRSDATRLTTPREDVYPVADPAVATRIGADPWSPTAP